jgi:hypothetical protein
MLPAVPIFPSRDTDRFGVHITVGRTDRGALLRTVSEYRFRAEIQRWLDGNSIDADSVRWYSDKKSGDDLNRPYLRQLKDSLS